MDSLKLALKFARREMRGGLRRFGIVIASLALGVGIIAGVGSLSAAIEAGFANDARAILGGDAEFRLAYREADATERAALEQGGKLSHAMELRAMVKARLFSISRSGEQARRKLPYLRQSMA